jgi:hypothetical protein
MSGLKGSTTKEATAVPDTVKLTTEERVEFIANLIVDRILEDRAESRALPKAIGGTKDVQQLTLA